jgi:protein TonB
MESGSGARRRARFLALVAAPEVPVDGVAAARHGALAARRATSRATQQAPLADQNAHRAYALPPFPTRQVAPAALAIALLHAALWWAWSHAPHSPATPVVTPPIAIEMTAPPKPLPEAPKSAPITPPKPLPKVPKSHAPRPQPRPSPTPTPPTAQPSPAAPSTPTASATAAPVAPAAPPAPAVPEKTTQPDANADYLHNPAPDYPSTAQDYGWQGKVVLHVHVKAEGSPDTIQVRASSGHRVLDDAAVAAVRQWSFVPAKRGPTPVDGWVDVPLNFQLN